MSKKVVIAYSGGEKNSVIIKWLNNHYGYDVITFTANLGQKKIEKAYNKAKILGIKKSYIEDLREIFVKKYIFPMFRANTIYEFGYLLGASIAQPLIIKRLIEIAKLNKSNIISYGTTNNKKTQSKFDLCTYSLNPYIKTIVPWRKFNYLSKKKLKKQFKIKQNKIDLLNKHNFINSINNNLLHTYYNGGFFKNTWNEPEKNLLIWSNSFKTAPKKETYIDISFKKGDPIAINNECLKPHELIIKLNNLGSKHGIGRIDIKNKGGIGFGLKSRCCYENPGVTILHQAHKAIESITLDRKALQIKDSLMPLYAELIYNGKWWTTERKMLQALIDTSQKFVNGNVRIKLYKGNVIIIGIKSKNSLIKSSYAAFEEKKSIYNQKDEDIVIQLKSIHFKIAAIKQHIKSI